MADEPSDLVNALLGPSTADIRRAYINANPRLALFDKYGLPPETDKPPRELLPRWFTGPRDAAMEWANSKLPPYALDAAMAVMPGPKFPARISNPIRAYHGSPHDFDAFDLSKIGTGQGAQAYGHGLYFADKEGVARSYRDALAQPTVTTRLGPDGSYILDERPSSGKMYEVALHASPEQFLDIEKPISQQSEYARKALARSGLSPQEPDLGTFAGQPIRGAPRWADTPEEAAKLREAGIPGIRYLDQGSRNAGSFQLLSPSQTVHGQWLVKQLPNGEVYYRGPDEAAARAAYQKYQPKETHNYVVWSPEIIEILRKYGLAGPAALGAMGAVTQDQNQQ